jgi:hypothetical protein
VHPGKPLGAFAANGSQVNRDRRKVGLVHIITKYLPTQF